MQTTAEISGIRKILAGNDLNKIRAIIKDFELLPYELRDLKRRFPALEVKSEITAFKNRRKEWGE